MSRTETTGEKKVSRLLMRGESMVASTGLAMAAIVLLAVAGAGAWTVYAQRQSDRAHVARSLESWGQLLARGVEQHLAADELSAARALVVNEAAEHGLSSCRLTLLDGVVLSDAQPKMSAVKELPEEWPAGAAPELRVERAGATVNMTVPVVVPGKGYARLDLSKPVDYSLMAGLEAQMGIAGVGAAGAIAVLLVYRRLRWKLRALGAIREALLALERGESGAATLSVSGAFGAEAQAWNLLLKEREDLKREAKAERARESLGGRKEKTDLAQACDALWQGMLLVDEKMCVKYANGAAAVFLGAKKGGITGEPIGGFVKDPQVLEALKAVVVGGSRKRATVEVKRTDGEGAGVLRMSVRPVRKEDSAAALLMIEDITQQRVADEARNAFVAQATHELRTPLTNIRLYTEQAIEAGDDKGILTRALDVINQESRRLERIVGDMLSVSEMEAGSFLMRTGDVRLETLFDDLKAEYEPQAKDKGLTLSLALPPKLPVLTGDRDKIVLALHNLMGNALKYTPEGGKVDVKVEADEKVLTVDVADSGIGIAPEEAELIFEKFYRAKDDRVNQITGTGLGLALAREVARMHGGDIHVKSQINQGSTFTLTLPVRAAA